MSAQRDCDSTRTINIFSNYAQAENQFTNGLFSLLELSTFENPGLVSSFICEQLSVANAGQISIFRVLLGGPEDGTADAELRGGNCCLRFETKIVPEALDKGQIQRHLGYLSSQAE